ncbi:MAG: hypothetical protein KF764_11330 [Labilithrix sp.]|nr:hypothetical protein [Labilithrix sp.]
MTTTNTNETTDTTTNTSAASECMCTFTGVMATLCRVRRIVQKRLGPPSSPHYGREYLEPYASFAKGAEVPIPREVLTGLVRESLQAGVGSKTLKRLVRRDYGRGYAHYFDYELASLQMAQVPLDFWGLAELRFPSEFLDVEKEPVADAAIEAIADATVESPSEG